MPPNRIIDGGIGRAYKKSIPSEYFSISVHKTTLVASQLSGSLPNVAFCERDYLS